MNIKAHIAADKNILIMDRKFFIPTAAFLISLLLIIFIESIFIPFIFLIVAVLLCTPGVKKIPLFAVFGFLLLISDIFEDYRVIINSFLIIGLSFYFIKEYGLRLVAYPRIPAGIGWLILSLLLSITISTITSSHFKTSVEYLFKTSAFIIIVYLYFSYINTVKKTKEIFFALILIGTISSIFIIHSFFSEVKSLLLLQLQGYVQIGGIYQNLSAVGGLLFISLSLTVVAINFKKFSSPPKMILWLLFIVQLFALILTNSRGAFLGLVVTCSVFFFIMKRKIFTISLLSFLGVIAVILILFPTTIDIIDSFFRTGRILENHRYQLWQEGIEIIKEHPILGIGPGTFGFYIYKYLPVMLGSWDIGNFVYISENVRVGHVHNYYLFYFSELGIWGFINSILIPVVFFRYSVKSMKKYLQGNKNLYILSVGIFSCGIGFFVRALIESTGIMTYGFITRDLPFWLLFIIQIYLSKQNIGNSGLGEEKMQYE